MKILTIRFSSIGDIVLASPVWRCIKKQLPGAEVHLVTKLAYKMVTASNPHIDKFHYYDDNLSDLIGKLKEEQFDYILDLHNNARSWKIKRQLKVESYSIKKLNAEKFLLSNLNINLLSGSHITRRSLDVIQALGVKDDGYGLDYFIPESEVTSLEDIPTSHHLGYLAIVIGATYYTKKLPVHKLQELCRKLDHPIILLGGKEDRTLGDEVASVDSVKIYNACGKFKLNESADLVKKSKLVISHDTGLMHIAAAFQKPVITIWGNTVPLFGMYPYYGSRSSQTYQSASVKLRCRPCSKLGYDHCPLEHFRCMEWQDIDAIVNMVYSRIGRSVE